MVEDTHTRGVASGQHLGSSVHLQANVVLYGSNFERIGIFKAFHAVQTQ